MLVADGTSTAETVVAILVNESIYGDAATHMKYSSNNLHEPGIVLPLMFPVKIVVEYRPKGILIDSAPVVFSSDPEAIADETVIARGWNNRPGYDPLDVWVDGAF